MPYSSSELLAALPRLRRYARLLIDDPARADELVARTLARARRGGAPEAASAHRAELLALLRAMCAEELAGSPPPLPLGSVPPVANETAAADANADRAHQVLGELRRLPVDQREVIVLVGVERMSYAEVATLLRVPVATVLARLLQARAALRSSAIGPASGRDDAIETS